jgi:S1-C subfamily serine protease
MNTAIYSPSGASAGIGFAVPIDTVNRVAPALIAHGKYVRPSLGIEFDDDLNNLMRSRLGVDGVYVLKVQADGPAAAAGLRGARIEGGSHLIPGDVIVAIGEKPVSTVSRLQARLDDFNWLEGRRTFSTARVDIPVGEKKAAQLVRRIALERIETVLGSIEALKVNDSAIKSHGQKNRVLVTASIAADVEE